MYMYTCVYVYIGPSRCPTPPLCLRRRGGGLEKGGRGCEQVVATIMTINMNGSINVSKAKATKSHDGRGVLGQGRLMIL